MNCQHVNHNLLAYIDNELPAPDREAIRLHLQSCPDCQRELLLLANAEQRLTQFLQAQAAQAAPSAQAWHKLQARLAAKQRPASRLALPWQNRLWQNLLSKLNQIKLTFQGGMNMKKGLAVTGMLLLLFLSTLLFVPQARAVAQGIIDTLFRQAGVSQTTIITIEDGQIVEREVRTVERWQPLSLAEVQAEVDYTVQLPSYLPAGYTVEWFDLVEPLNLVIVSFRTGAGLERIDSFDLYQTRGDTGRFLGGKPVAEHLINGNAALMTSSEATVYDSEGRPSPQVAHILYWQEGDISFAIHSYSLTPAEMVRIAESIRPVEVGE
jgi:anti-sigma factor RsiW